MNEKIASIYGKTIDTAENTLEKLFTFAEKKLLLTTILLFVIASLIRLYFTPFAVILREDAYVYLVKAVEITQGNFIPNLSHAVGWSMFLAPFLYLFGSESIFQNMTVARFVGAVLGAALIFPLALIGKKLLDSRSVIVVLILFTFSQSLIKYSGWALTEPLFTFLFLLTLLCIFKAKENRNYLLIAAVFAGLSYYVRSNGIVVLAILVLTAYFMRKSIPKFSYKHLALIVIIFFITASPFLYQRYETYGSAFSYGPTSKYFVDHYSKVWSNNIPVPSLTDYLTTHPVSDWISKFFVQGFLGAMLNYLFFALSPLIVLFFIYGFAVNARKEKYLPFVITIGLWIMSLIPIFNIFRTPRYFFALIPLSIIFAVLAIKELTKNAEKRNIFICTLLLIFILFSLQGLRSENTQQNNVKDGLIWAEWVADNIQGKIMVIEGGDLIMMHLPDASVAGVSAQDFYAPDSGISIIRPGYFHNLKDGMDWLRDQGTTHMILDEKNLNRRVYLEEAFKNDRPDYLEELYSNYDTDNVWKVRVYKINWDTYEEQVN